MGGATSTIVIATSLIVSAAAVEGSLVLVAEGAAAVAVATGITVVVVVAIAGVGAYVAYRVYKSLDERKQ